MNQEEDDGDDDKGSDADSVNKDKSEKKGKTGNKQAKKTSGTVYTS